MNVHCLKKGCGQNWADHLPIHVVKELMGHRDIFTTYKFCSQVELYQRKQAAKVIHALVGEPETDERGKSGREGGKSNTG